MCLLFVFEGFVTSPCVISPNNGHQPQPLGVKFINLQNVHHTLYIHIPKAECNSASGRPQHRGVKV